MLCKDCEHGHLYIDFSRDKRYGGGCAVCCWKYGITCDTAHPETRQCIEEDFDVLWRAGWEKGPRWDGGKKS